MAPVVFGYDEVERTRMVFVQKSNGKCAMKTHRIDNPMLSVQPAYLANGFIGLGRLWPRACLFLAVALPLILSGCSAATTGFGQPGIEYVHLERAEPRPLQIHVLKIDLKEKGLTLAVDVAPDPDGEAPAETTLISPLDHAERGEFVAAVNANPWSMVPPPPAGEHPRYVADAACDIAGWVVSDGVERSPQSGLSFWMGRDGTPHLGNVAPPATDAQCAIAGFGRLLRNGEVLPGPSKVRHPRTAVGMDRDARILILAVVDGRQRGYSEGVSERELAELMVELGSYNALNLDGGGSSVMILRDATGKARIVNRPSDKRGPRPVPVLFGVRRVP